MEGVGHEWEGNVYLVISAIWFSYLCYRSYRKLYYEIEHLSIPYVHKNILKIDLEGYNSNLNLQEPAYGRLKSSYHGR